MHSNTPSVMLLVEIWCSLHEPSAIHRTLISVLFRSHSIACISSKLLYHTIGILLSILSIFRLFYEAKWVYNEPGYVIIVQYRSSFVIIHCSVQYYRSIIFRSMSEDTYSSFKKGSWQSSGYWVSYKCSKHVRVFWRFRDIPDWASVSTFWATFTRPLRVENTYCGFHRYSVCYWSTYSVLVVYDSPLTEVICRKTHV